MNTRDNIHNMQNNTSFPFNMVMVGIHSLSSLLSIGILMSFCIFPSHITLSRMTTKILLILLNDAL